MSGESQSQRTFRLELRVLGRSVSAETAEPDHPIRLDEVLPFLRNIDDQVIELAVQRAQSQGAEISCRKGCSACCRAQPVPVTPQEAYALWRLVEALPESRRTEIRGRFADRVQRLGSAGLDSIFLDRDPNLTKEQARAIAERYFRLGLVCPFLEDDSCGIYMDRPFVCRQYLVTSPAELCSDPFHNAVRPVSIPLTPASAALRTAESFLKFPQYTVPLVLALEYAQAHRRELEQTFEPKELLNRSVKNLVEEKETETASKR